MLFAKWIGKKKMKKNSDHILVIKGDIIEVHAREQTPSKDGEYICRGSRQRGYFMADEWDFKFGFTPVE
jgi:hypothetical protein